jgi:hypothetical protein
MNKEPFGSVRIDHIDAHVKEHFAPIGSLGDNEQMGRPKSFNREDVLKKAMPVFWRRGFADASLDGQKGCFAVSSMREFPILPHEAIAIVTRSRS